MGLQTGRQAPDLRLYNTEKQEVDLKQLRGKNVVLLFFPFAFTGVCTAELCSVRDNLSMYNDLDAAVFGISVDSLHSLRKFKEEQKLNFDLLSDFNKEASLAYDALYEQFSFGMKGVSKRAAFVIDKNGVVKYAEVLENAGLQPDFKKIKETLEQLN